MCDKYVSVNLEWKKKTQQNKKKKKHSETTAVKRRITTILSPYKWKKKRIKRTKSKLIVYIGLTVQWCSCYTLDNMPIWMFYYTHKYSYMQTSYDFWCNMFEDKQKYCISFSIYIHIIGMNAIYSSHIEI